MQRIPDARHFSEGSSPGVTAQDAVQEAVSRPSELPVRGALATGVVRAVDVLVASSILIAASPLMLAIAILVRRGSPGPVLFRHERVGRNDRRRNEYVAVDRRKKVGYGRPFTLYKFRTMYADSRERFPELYEYSYDRDELKSMPIKILVGTKRLEDPDPGPSDSIAVDDPRVTSVGRWLRRTSLDELPNLINVLRGDMHLVGPRPDIAENIVYYEPRHLGKLNVRPGVTGLAQVRGRGNLSFNDTNDWDIEYVENRSLALDLKILMRTIWVLVRAHGAY